MGSPILANSVSASTDLGVETLACTFTPPVGGTDKINGVAVFLRQGTVTGAGNAEVSISTGVGSARLEIATVNLAGTGDSNMVVIDPEVAPILPLGLIVEVTNGSDTVADFIASVCWDEGPEFTSSGWVA